MNRISAGVVTTKGWPFRLGLAAAGLSLAAAFGAHATTLVNASFEQPGGAPIRQALSDGDTFIPGWSVSGIGQYYESSGADGINAADGGYYVSFGHNGTTGGSITQTFSSLLGANYTLNYQFRLQQGSETGSGFRVSASTGDSVDSFDAILANWASGPALTFVGTGGAVTLTFLDITTSGGASNLALDDVRLTNDATSGTPEPASWALMICGFGMAGAALRRRRTANAQ